jgi:hypothetical protein
MEIQSKRIMNILKKYLPYLLVVLLLGIVFRNWILSPVSIGGDFNFIHLDKYSFPPQKPFVWDYSLNNGFGAYILFTLTSYWYYFFVMNAFSFIKDIFLLQKIVYLFPILIMGYCSMWYLTKKIAPSSYARATAIALYLLNPYAIMLISGGQIGVAWAYALAPFVLTAAIHCLRSIRNESPLHKRIKWALILSVSLAVEIMFDSRVALLVLGMITLLYAGYFLFTNEKIYTLKEYAWILLVISITCIGIHLYWIAPSVLVQAVSLPQGYASDEAVKFFSFARFAHAFTWTHPNYPQNEFGVVKEVSGLAFIVPLLAFFTLKNTRKVIVYFSIVALGAAFLIKGTNDPFGEIYLWMFQHIPAFNWYRDATKFFIPLSIAYSVLIALAVEEAHTFLTKNPFTTIRETILKNRFHTPATTLLPVLLILAVPVILYIWWPTLTGQVKGTLAYHSYPPVYTTINTVLQKDTSYGRVLWIPSREMYGLTDVNHPAVSLKELRHQPGCLKVFCVSVPKQTDKEFTKEDLYKEIDTEMGLFSDPYTQEILQTLAVKYIIISPDVDQTIYRYDHKFDPSQRDRYQQNIAKAHWLQPKNTEPEIYEVPQIGAFIHTTQSNSSENVTYTMINPTHYELEIKETVSPIIMTQTYNDHWILTQGEKKVYPMPDKYGMNEFPIADLHKGKATLTFSGQDYTDRAWPYSLATLVSTVGLITIIHVKDKNKL